MTEWLRGVALETDVKNREFETVREHCLSREPVRGEGTCPGDHCRYRRKAREPNTYVLLISRAKPLDYSGT